MVDCRVTDVNITFLKHVQNAIQYVGCTTTLHLSMCLYLKIYLMFDFARILAIFGFGFAMLFIEKKNCIAMMSALQKLYGKYEMHG